MKAYLKETSILNYSSPSIQSFIKSKNWLALHPVERVKTIYNFVRDDIQFGYNISI